MSFPNLYIELLTFNKASGNLALMKVIRIKQRHKGMFLIKIYKKLLENLPSAYCM